ncbi:hypothetical protein GALMADRAFT_233779 [Galerina marginata CBS 339.88]|uniref:Uncharacterized protein n=1 Tax=Galerina marginata (strain CBS 339.88) TaxID=685588 RepID=A0A067TPN5_GALM3|nr:hypothetical protein GALMADRAFT_233779 [Galerina marginata CBS 339.88]
MHPPSATFLSREDRSSSKPTRSSASTVATPTDVHFNILQPRITPSPTSSCPPNTLIVQLSTTLVIPDFNLFYAPSAIDSFFPTYTALADGSLITPPFNQDQLDANLSLLVTGALAMVFARNIVVSGDYIRRGKVKKKTLFHVLFLSQILAPVAFIPIIMSYFSQRMHCTLVIILSCVSGASSLALLITVILGVKVYKCLNNARFIPIILGLFQAASTAVVIFDTTTTKGVRRLTGSCIRTDDLRFTRYFVIIQFVESLFICCCFIYVCWKSRGSPAARGRISIELSMDELPIEVPNDPPNNVQPTLRGWWDYVPEDAAGQQVQPKTATSGEGTKGTLRLLFNRMMGLRDQKSPLKGKKPKLQKRGPSEKGPTNPPGTGNIDPPRHSLAPSSMSRFSRLIPRMELFQEVMKDELLYTTFITSTCVVVAVLAIIGVNFKNGLSVTGWIALNWGIISLLAIHSFGRVVHRHERDALLHHPVTCTAILRAANEIVKKDDQTTRRRVSATSLPHTRSLRIASINDESNSDDPFADTQALQQENPFHSELDDQDFSSVASMLRSQPAVGKPGLLEPHLPSYLQRSQDMDFPTSNLGTPVVSITSADIDRQQRFTESWIVSSSYSNSRYSHSEDSFREEATT